MKVLLIDDQKLFRHGLRIFLQGIIKEAGILEASNETEALKIYETRKIDLVIMEIGIPLMKGIKLIKDLKRVDASNFSKVLILTKYLHASILYKILQLGVEGYTHKNVESDHLKEIINLLLKGATYYHNETTETMEKSIYSKRIFNFNISDNEIEIIKLLSLGKTNKEIAIFLGYTLRTAETKRYRLEKKFFAKNSSELVSIAYETGILKIN